MNHISIAQETSFNLLVVRVNGHIYNEVSIGPDNVVEQLEMVVRRVETYLVRGSSLSISVRVSW